jgi:hypothetical protein
LFLTPVLGANSPAAEIDLNTARRAAQAQIQQHYDFHGNWGGNETARVGSGTTVRLDDVAIAHHFSVLPAGHVLVAADDRFSPVLLYSPTSAFDPANRDDPASIEAWILPEILRALEELDKSGGPKYRSLSDSASGQAAAERIASAWSQYLSTGASAARSLSADEVDGARLSEGLIVGPLLSSRWGQGDYYNDQMPAISGDCAHALTGCVATAFAQVMRYWQWPFTGNGGHSYTWSGQTIYTDFGTPYDWTSMPDSLSASSLASEIDAVAHLMYDVAVAVETDFGCSGSSSMRYGDEILDSFFRYKTQMVRHSRSRYNASDWYDLIQGELDAQPPRPMLFSIFTADWSGHEVVIDGYQTGPTDKVHINMGWSGAYNGYYDITYNFTAAYEWQADYQVLVTGIEPDNTPPQVSAGGDQVAVMDQVVTLAGDATDPDGFTLAELRWRQRSGPLVSLSDADARQTTFTAPQVLAETVLEFELIAIDPHGAQASDLCSINLYPPQDHPIAVAGSDQTVSGGSEVTLTGAAMASEGHDIDSYTWVPPADTDQRTLNLTSVNSQEARFVAPDVEADTELVFTLQVSDTSGQIAEDVCVVMVRAALAPYESDTQSADADASPAANDTGSRSSSGGPCFLGAL